MARIFIATLGMAPAVITETLWALRQRSWVPDRIEVIGTVAAARAVRDSLMVPDGPMSTLYPAPRRVPPMTVFVPMRDTLSDRVRAMTTAWDPATGTITTDTPEGEAIADVNDAEAATCMGDLILDRVRAACGKAGNELHLSISGGRKTMSAHALFSLGLVGNLQDEASHVLMGGDPDARGEEFDANPQFWHPDQGGLIHSRAVQAQMRAACTPPADWPAPTVDPAAAARTLRLFPIAAPRFDRIPQKQPRGRALPRLSRIMGQMTLAGDWLRAPSMELYPHVNGVRINGAAAVLDPLDFVWLRVLATAADEGWTCPHDHGQPPGAVTAGRILFGQPAHGNLDRIRQWFEAAVTAGLRGDDVARKAAQRTDQLGQDAEGKGGQSLGVHLRTWTRNLTDQAARSPGALAAEEADVADDLIRVIKSFNDLKSHLTEAFGLPLATELLPKSKTRSPKLAGIPQVAYRLGGARAGFLRVVEGRGLPDSGKTGEPSA